MRQREKPNVIICACDQLRAFEVGCYGNDVVRTPNIDRLAENGVRFDVACSNNPVCTPARSVLLSGQYSRTCMGTLGNVPEPVMERDKMQDVTLAEAFRAAGYTTGLIGKWHIHVEPTVLGFDTAFYPLIMHRNTGQTFLGSDGRRFTTERFCPDVEQEELESWIGAHKDEPFFLYYNISQPHMPLIDAPERYERMFSKNEVPLRENVSVNGKIAHDENWFKIYLWDFLYYREHLPYTEKLPDGFDLRTMTALYYGMTAWADDQLGGLVRMLKDNSLLDNTIIIFTSDHGDNLGSHHLFNKQELYEESIRIPMIVHWPLGLKHREVETQVASLVDVMPTALSLAGLDTPKTAQGTDLAAVARGEAEQAGDNIAFIETSEFQIGLRTPTHLYGAKLDREAENPPKIEDHGHMFFDVESDPMEMRNLIDSGDQREGANRLYERLAHWDRETPWLNDVCR